MKNLFLLIAMCFCLMQTTTAQISKGSVGLVGSGDFYTYSFKPDLQTGGLYDRVFNYSLGLEGGYRFSDSFSGSLGLVGSKKGFKKEYLGNVIDPEHQEGLRNTRLDIYYLDIPILVDYDIYINNTVSVFASAGVVPGILADKREVSNYNTDTDRRTTFMTGNIDKFVMSGQVSGGLKLQLYDTKSIRIEPYFRKYFNQISPSLMEKNPNAYGLQLGIYQHF